MDLIKFVDDQTIKADVPVFKTGDTITVHYKIREGNKERIQLYQGVVIQRNSTGANKTFTVRKISNSIGVERIFPLNSRGAVRRAKIFYLRGLTGKKARIKAKRN